MMWIRQAVFGDIVKTVCLKNIPKGLYPHQKERAYEVEKDNKKNTIWVKREVEVILPIEGYGKYQDIFTYLVKVVDICDPKFEFIVGLLSYIYWSGGICDGKQQKLADDIISYYKAKGYFREDFK